MFYYCAHCCDSEETKRKYCNRLDQPLFHPSGAVKETRDRTTRRNQSVICLGQFFTQRHIQDGEQMLKLIKSAGANERRGDAGADLSPRVSPTGLGKYREPQPD